MGGKFDIVPDTEPGEMAKSTDLALKIASMPPIEFQNVQQLADRIQWYFDFCMEHDARPCIMGICLSIGCSRESLRKWENEKTERGAVIRRAKGVIRYLLEEWSITGKLSPPVAIFWSKNLLNMSDRQVLEITRSDYDYTEQNLSPEEIARQLEENIPLPLDTEYKEAASDAE